MDDPTLPASYTLALVELVKRWRVTAEELLSGTGVRPDVLEDPQERIPISASIRIIERARALTGEPALGFYLGMQARISMHGFLGFAALSAATMGEAIEIAIQFIPIVTTSIALRLRVDGRMASIIAEERADWGTARDFVFPALLVGLWQVSKSLSGSLHGRSLREAYIELALPEPPYQKKVEAISRRVRFDQPAHRLLFDASLLELPYVMADPVALRLAKDQCERALNSLGLGGQVVARVRRLISRSEGGFRSLEEVAVALHLSPRTLKRQLAGEGLSFSNLLEKERHERALLLLRAPELTIGQVASRLGYSNVANFSRAFRRWTSSTPAEYRRRGQPVDRP